MIRTNILPYGVKFSGGKWHVFDLNNGKTVRGATYHFRWFATIHRDMLNSMG